MQSKAWPRWSDLSAALSKSGIRLSPKPDEAALEPGGAGGKQLVGRSIIYHWTEHGWCSGVIERTNSDKSKMIDGDMVNFMVHYEVDENLSDHVLQLASYVPDGPANSWVLLEPVAEPETPPVAEPETPPVRDDALVGTEVALEAEAETRKRERLAKGADQATDEGGGDGEGDGSGPPRKRKTAPSAQREAQPLSDRTLRRRDSKSLEPEIQPSSAATQPAREAAREGRTPRLPEKRGCQVLEHEAGSSSCNKPAWHEGSHDGPSRGNGESTQSGQGGTRTLRRRGSSSRHRRHLPTHRKGCPPPGPRPGWRSPRRAQSTG